jgi:hypothetical protein
MELYRRIAGIRGEEEADVTSWTYSSTVTATLRRASLRSSPWRSWPALRPWQGLR